MASLRRKVYVDKRGIKQKSKKWYVRYRDADGINREVPGFRDKEASKQLAAQLEREAELGRVGVRDPFAKHRKQSLSGHVDSFEESLSSAGFSSKYVENTSRWVRKSLKGIQANYFDDITTSAVQKFLGDLAKAGRSPATINNYSSSLQTFLNWG